MIFEFILWRWQLFKAVFLVQYIISYQIYSLDYLTSQNYMSFTLSPLFLFHRIIWFIYVLPDAASHHRGTVASVPCQWDCLCWPGAHNGCVCVCVIQKRFFTNTSGLFCSSRKSCFHLYERNKPVILKKKEETNKPVTYQHIKPLWDKAAFWNPD
jgi:hypothetical protein